MTSTEQKFYTALLTIEDKLVKIEEMIKNWEKELEQKNSKKTSKNNKNKTQDKAQNLTIITYYIPLFIWHSKYLMQNSKN